MRWKRPGCGRSLEAARLALSPASPSHEAAPQQSAGRWRGTVVCTVVCGVSVKAVHRLPTPHTQMLYACVDRGDERKA